MASKVGFKFADQSEIDDVITDPFEMKIIDILQPYNILASPKTKGLIFSIYRYTCIQTAPAQHSQNVHYQQHSEE